MSAPALVTRPLEVPMKVPAVVQRLITVGLKVAAALAFVAPLLARLVIGKGFYDTGSGKLANFDNIVSFFTDLGIPFPELNAAFVARLEFYGGILLAVGLLTRFVSLALISTMVVALMTADKSNLVKALSGGDVGIMEVTPIPFLVPLVWLALSGPGVASLDHLLVKWLGVDLRTGEADSEARPAD